MIPYYLPIIVGFPIILINLFFTYYVNFVKSWIANFGKKLLLFMGRYIVDKIMTMKINFYKYGWI